MEQTDDIDLNAYFGRIGYAGPRSASLAVLRAIHAAHPQAIAFENLDPLMRVPVRIDAHSIQDKLIRAGRGGYCYEQNGLLMRVLRALGFEVTGLSARALFGHASGSTPRTHMLLKVETEEGPHIADVGFGSRTLSAPLRLEERIEQQTPHGFYRLIRAGAYLEEQACIDGEWKSLYRFTFEEQTPQDYEVCNWYHSTNPNSYFTTKLMVSRLDADRRLGLFNNQFAIHSADGRTERRVLSNPAEIANVLERDFRIALSTPRQALLDAIARTLG
jgi:N-hydroxyarylamine O-acetyltransferase